MICPVLPCGLWASLRTEGVTVPQPSRGWSWEWRACAWPCEIDLTSLVLPRGGEQAPPESDSPRDATRGRSTDMTEFCRVYVTVSSSKAGFGSSLRKWVNCWRAGMAGNWERKSLWGISYWAFIKGRYDLSAFIPLNRHNHPDEGLYYFFTGLTKKWRLRGTCPGSHSGGAGV